MVVVKKKKFTLDYILSFPEKKKKEKQIQAKTAAAAATKEKRKKKKNPVKEVVLSSGSSAGN